ncbi:MAG: CRTAC1 family protein [Acidobacteriota bacterium]|nr:CRTAC1 family protein [Acidobacteriota bacterium]
MSYSRICTVLFLVSALFGSAAEAPLFTEVKPSSGFDFVHYNGMNGKYYLPEIMNPGGALFDYDGDGDLDLYLVQGGTLPAGGDASKTLVPYKGKGVPKDRLYRTDIDKSGKISFTDVTDKAGLNATGYGMGVTTGDVDNDGDLDLYVTNFGPNQLWLNNGDGTFSDTTAKAGVSDPGLSTSAAFIDLDRDGDLDLFMADYVLMNLDKYPNCYASDSSLDYCGPDAFPAAKDRFFLNNGDGTFKDATSLIRDAEAGAGLGVVTCDLDNDGWLDIYVANDGDPNHLWRNKGDGTFEEIGLLAGVALNGVGAAEAGMGVTAGDFDGDGDEDLFMTHLDEETNTLYTNQGDNFFDDGTNSAGLAMVSMKYTGFGTGWIDLDNDGWLDLVALNGAVRVQAEKKGIFPLQQANQIFMNLAGKGFAEANERGGSAFTDEEVSRGAAIGDVDSDGDADLLIINCNGPARLLLNNGSMNNWLGLRLVTGKRDALGAQATVHTASGRKLYRRARTDGSYCSARDPRLLFGLAAEKKITGIDVIWPDGKKERFPAVETGRYHTLTQGKGGKP